MGSALLEDSIALRMQNSDSMHITLMFIVEYLAIHEWVGGRESKVLLVCEVLHFWGMNVGALFYESMNVGEFFQMGKAFSSIGA